MKRFFVLATLLLCMLTAITTFAASKDSVVEQRKQVDQLSAKVLEKLYETYPHAQRVIKECYAVEFGRGDFVCRFKSRARACLQ